MSKALTVKKITLEPRPEIISQTRREETLGIGLLEIICV